MFEDTQHNYNIENGNVKKLVKVTTITLDSLSGNIEEGDTITITASTNDDNTEDLIWYSSDETIATVESSGMGSKIGKIVGIKVGTARIEITNLDETVKVIYDVTVTSSYIDDSYVAYNVEYIDVYTETNYTKNTGWRLLSKTQNADGTYNIDIISTGIPARLNFYYQFMDSTSWRGSAADIAKYTKNYYAPYSATSSNAYSSSGLRYNFEKIQFNNKSNYINNGLFLSVKNGDTVITAADTTTGKDLFKVSNLPSGTVSEIRSVTLGDIRKDDSSTDISPIISNTEQKIGLFKLDLYTPDIHNKGDYLLASPNPSVYGQIYSVNYNGLIGTAAIGVSGLRPVISITGVKLEKNEHVWQIVN